MQRVLVVNGPNLNLLGTRQPEIYGATTLVQLDQMCREWGGDLGFAIETHQSNHEGDLIDRLQANRDAVSGVVINAGAFTHYSYALHDALESIPAPAVEVHISNIKQRESWRRDSVIAPACVATIYGRGIDGYLWGLRHLAYRAAWPVDEISYGTEADQLGDLRIPDGVGPHPVAVLIHGGFWRDSWQRDTMDGVAVALARAGVATWNVEYRRVGSGGGWPTTLTDAEKAADHLTELADRHQLDLDRVVAVGHSAGGQLALCIAARDKAAVTLAGVVGLAPVSDLVVAHDQDVGRGAVEGFVGSVPAPDTAGAVPGSPMHQLPIGVPQVIVHGDADNSVPIEMSRDYLAAAQASGDDARLEALAGIDHFAPIDPSSTVWPAVESAVMGLL